MIVRAECDMKWKMSERIHFKEWMMFWLGLSTSLAYILFDIHITLNEFPILLMAQTIFECDVHQTVTEWGGKPYSRKNCPVKTKHTDENKLRFGFTWKMKEKPSRNVVWIFTLLSRKIGGFHFVAHLKSAVFVVCHRRSVWCAYAHNRCPDVYLYHFALLTRVPTALEKLA